jgi:dienelactone hydrolase
VRRRALAAFLALAWAVAAPAAASRNGATLTLTPVGGIQDAPFKVTLAGVNPGTRVVIRVTRRTDDGHPWSAVGVFRANARGVVDAARSRSLGGTYSGISAHGLLCSALPVEPDKIDAFVAGFARNPRQDRSFPDPLGRTEIALTASIGGRIVASTSGWRSYPVGTRGEAVDVAEGWKGVFFPAAEGVKPGLPVLLLAGSGGGIFRYTAARLASHGHPTLAFAMFRYPGLPDSLVEYPLERVRNGALWLANRAGGERPVIMGISRGSEAAALAGVHFPDAFSGHILLVPSHLADAGALGSAAKQGASAWSIGGKPTPVTDLGFTPDDPRVVEQARTPPGYNASAMVLDRWASPSFEARYGIPFERLKAPVLVLAAGQDAVWPSWVSAERIHKRLVAHGKAGLAEIHIYPAAGHGMVDLGFGGPLSTFSYNPLLKGFMALGGEPNANCEASFDSVRAILAFLDRVPHQSH